MWALISLDGGVHWAQYKGGDFPEVPVRDLVVSPLHSELVLATHGRGIWIIDDISPLRELTPEVMAKDAVFLTSKPIEQRLEAWGGWAEGDATFVGADPPRGAFITYYQRKRHIFGRMKIEIFDAQGKLVDTLPANSRRGLSRLEWSMRLKAPRVPPAATLAGEAAEGVRVLPGTYTVRMTRGKETYTTPLTLTLDRRASFTVEDRQQQYAAALRLYAVLRDMSFTVDRINRVHDALMTRAAGLKQDDPLQSRLNGLTRRTEELRKKIVATKEGGAVTGEERIREKTTQIYGAVVGYEGRPGDYYLTRIDSLKRELDDVSKDFDALSARALPPLNASLEKKKLQPVVPLTRADWENANADSGTGSAASAGLLMNAAAWAFRGQ